ncbi:MAG: DUF1579 domain-containing protein [Planctomycetota bacterium]|nr:MAG: DUF1579 domain-containing protein [Planctomycetota bacterium]REJ95265.1 MAG: DUF1579 domain-containing protein [Planctomycetota bacterium]REK26255.1 MAG: DUF1579 domain-containing protein [Planctomycetota bacterium]REK34387.1 MAG: DUF1579 domain-containing protein [Planctomycetota bacterium]
MKTLTIALTALVVSSQASAQELPNPQPTEAHKVLAAEEGTWDAAVKMYFQGPTEPATEYEGVEVCKMVSGGLYSQSTFTCQMGDTEFEGHGLMGYDSRTKEYTGVWVDNFNTVPMPMNGTYDKEANSLTVHTTVVDENTGIELKQKQITTFVDDDTRTFVIYLLVEAGGETQEIKLMEMTSKRREE